MLNNKELQEYQKGLAILYFGLFGGLVIFMLISLLLVTTNSLETDAGLRNLFLIVVPLLIFAGFIASHLLGSRFLRKAVEAPQIEDKLVQYRSYVMVRCAMLELPGFIAVFAFLLSGERMFLGFLAILLFYFVTLFPSTDKIINDLNINE